MNYIGFKTKGGGIYKIENLVTGKVYIGKTGNFYKRYHQHLTSHRRKEYHKSNRLLLDDYEIFGIDNFTFEEIYYPLLKDESDIMESYFMEEYNSFNSDTGYNLRKDTETGMIASDMTSSKISERLKKEWSKGFRDGHSDKLKESWNNRDREAQSNLFTKILTKYYYCLNQDYDVKLHYKDIVDLGLKACMSSFSKKGKDLVICKGFTVERFKYEN